MRKSKFSVTHKDESLVELVKETDHKTLAVWAIDCVERVLPYFEEKYPEDNRPRKAIEACKEWVRTGVFKMADVRKAALESHTAARQVGEDNPARAAARAAGQAVATAHVPTHSIGAANYALQAVYRATNASGADAAIAKERDWQYQHLLDLRKEMISERGAD
jgi:immunity protein 5 of polymorphic toxin system